MLCVIVEIFTIEKKTYRFPVTDIRRSTYAHCKRKIQRELSKRHLHLNVFLGMIEIQISMTFEVIVYIIKFGSTYKGLSNMEDAQSR